MWCVWLSLPSALSRVEGKEQDKLVTNDVARGRLINFISQVIKPCRRIGVYVVLEGPAGAKTWNFRQISSTTRGLLTSITRFCSFGRSFQRSTKLVGNFPGLESLGRDCGCVRQHELLAGKLRLDSPTTNQVGWFWKASLAGIYPTSFCTRVAGLLAKCCPSSGLRGVDELVFHRYWTCTPDRAHRPVHCEAPILPNWPPSEKATGWEQATDCALGVSPINRRRHVGAVQGHAPSRAIQAVSSSSRSGIFDLFGDCSAAGSCGAEETCHGPGKSRSRRRRDRRSAFETKAAQILQNSWSVPRHNSRVSQAVCAYTSCSTILDRCLDVALNKMFVAGKHVSQCLHLFYAVRWFHNLLSSEMRYSTLSRKGFQKACRVRAPCPLTWEEVLVMSLALCQELCSIYSAKIRAAAALGFLLAFECYGRGGDVSAVEATELRPPIGRKS